MITRTNRLTRTMLLAMLACLPGCYRATLQTGLRPTSEVRERVWTKPFALSEAPVAEIAQLGGCTTGVAKVETTRTVLDQIAGIFDGGAGSGTRLLITCAVAPAPADPTASDSLVGPHAPVPDSARVASAPPPR